MSRSYWIAAVALGLINLAGAAQAQEQAVEPSTAQQRSDQTANSSDMPVPLPVEIVESEAQRETRQSQLEETLQLQADDLAAQLAANEASQRMADSAGVQTWLIGIGTILLLVTLGLTLQANRAAREAVSVTREVGRDQSRAYLSITGAYLYLFHGSQITIGIRNIGLTPPRWIEVAGRLKIFNNGEEAKFTADGESVETERWHTTVFNEETRFAPSFAIPDGYTGLHNVCRKLWGSEEAGIAIEGFLRWETLFGEVFESEFYFWSAVDPNSAEPAKDGGLPGPVRMRHPSVNLRAYERLEPKTQKPEK